MTDLLPIAVLMVAVAVHLFGSLIFVRATLERRPPLTRLAFVVREIALFIIVMSAMPAAPWVAYLFAFYSACSLYARADVATSTQMPRPSGMSRLLVK